MGYQSPVGSRRKGTADGQSQIRVQAESSHTNSFHGAARGNNSVIVGVRAHFFKVVRVDTRLMTTETQAQWRGRPKHRNGLSSQRKQV